MTYEIIPVPAVPTCQFNVILDGGLAQIRLTTTDYGLFADVTYQGVSVATGRLCRDRTDINPDRYLGLAQFLGFADLQGNSAPVYTGFGTQYVLIYGNPDANGGTIFA